MGRGETGSGVKVNEARNLSVAFPRRHWYPACSSAELSARPVRIELMETPVVLYRDRRGGAHALIDRCPHRNAPLSFGRVHDDGSLECPYHGWRFDGEGRCRAVPGLVTADPSSPTRDVPFHPVRESDGFVWIWAEPSTPSKPSEPDHEPLRLPDLRRPASDGRPAQTSSGIGEVVLRFDLDCTVHAAVENALDVPHTAFLHRGIFRGSSDPNTISARRRVIPGGVEVEYVGEPVGMGPVRARRGALTFQHWDRFLLPSTAQIEYRVPGWVHVVNTIPHLPLAPLRTRCWFVVRYWSRLPARLVQPVVWARGQQIARQDVRMLAEQTSNILRFGGERYTSTDLDLLGPAVWRLMRQAERQEQQPAQDPPTAPAGTGQVETFEREVTFRA